MLVKIDVELCDRCGACVAVCPKLAISLSIDTIYIDYGKCIQCQQCKMVCPVEAISVE